MSNARFLSRSFLAHAFLAALSMGFILAIGFGGMFLAAIHTPVNLVWIPLTIGTVLVFSAIKWLEARFESKYQ